MVGTSLIMITSGQRYTEKYISTCKPRRRECTTATTFDPILKLKIGRNFRPISELTKIVKSRIVLQPIEARKKVYVVGVVCPPDWNRVN